MNIILIRHAQTIKNKEGICQSHNDSGMSEEGLIQLSKTKEFLKEYGVHKVYCSSLGRTVKIAETIFENHDVEIIPDDRLKEVDWGEFSILKTSEMLEKWSNYYEKEKANGIPREEIRPPLGENAFDHLIRIQDFFDYILENHLEDNIAIIGHGGTNKVLIGMLRNKDPEEFYEVKQDNACINFIEVDGNGKVVNEELNVVRHLK